MKAASGTEESEESEEGRREETRDGERRRGL